MEKENGRLENYQQKISGKFFVSVQPKPGFSIGNWNQGPISVSVLEQIFSFQNRIFFQFDLYIIVYDIGNLQKKIKKIVLTFPC